MFCKTAKLLSVLRSVQYSALQRSRKSCTSALYITGDHGMESCSVLTPFVNLDNRFKNISELESNVKHRNLNIDLNKLKSSWEKYKTIKDRHLELQKKISENFVKLKSAGMHQSRSLDKIKDETKRIRDELKLVTRVLWDLEKEAIIGGLALPNHIHPETPNNGSEKLVHEFGIKPDCNSRCASHLETANKLNLMEYYDSSYYFLKDDAVKFEIGTSFFFLDYFGVNGFILTSNSDFGKSVVVEGIGLDPTDATSVFTMEVESDSKDPVSRLHLIGGASLASFAAYHTKTITNSKNLPLRYITSGRHYSPGNAHGLHGLFSTWQSSTVETFILTADDSQAMEEFKLCLNHAIHLYESLGYHFQVKYLPPSSLRSCESLRASFQMYSKNMKSYVEVGSLSMCSDYISQRLLMCCETSNKCSKPMDFTHIVTGTLVSIPHLLGCVLEYDGDNFQVPSKLASLVS